MKRTPIKGKGKRGLLRQRYNRELGKLGITHCELHSGCWNNFGLTWAHSMKSRFLITPEDWMQACRACIPCHEKIESMSHAEMRAIVVAAIERRNECS